MSVELSASELSDLVRRVFAPRPDDRALAILVDVPDAELADRPVWAARRAMAAGWVARLREVAGDLGLERVDLVAYRNVRRNNADLPVRTTPTGAIGTTCRSPTCSTATT